MYGIGPNNLRVTSKDKAQTLMKNLCLEVEIQFGEEEDIILDSWLYHHHHHREKNSPFEDK